VLTHTAATSWGFSRSISKESEETKTSGVICPAAKSWASVMSFKNDSEALRPSCESNIFCPEKKFEKGHAYFTAKSMKIIIIAINKYAMHILLPRA